MGTINKFEDVIAWQKAKELVNAIYALTKSAQFAKDFALKDQIRRAAISVMTNIAEGFGRKTDKDFANFLNIAHGSVAEVQSLLYVAKDQEYISEEDFNKYYELALEVSSMLQKFSNYLRKGL